MRVSKIVAGLAGCAVTVGSLVLSTGPVVGETPDGTELSVVVGKPTLTEEQHTGIAAKDAWAAKQNSYQLASSATIGAMTQVVQSNSYYCGPAALTMVLKSRSISRTQSQAATSLGTTTDGTAWYTGSQYPMASALNAIITSPGVNYYPASLSYSPTSSEKSSYKSRLTADINAVFGLAGNAYEVAGGPHLPGHPANQTIYHWVAIRAYSESGAKSHYIDPAWGAPSISWSSTVPSYPSISSDTLVTIMGGRGYIW